MDIEEKIRREYEVGATYRQLAKKYRKSFTQIAEILHPEKKVEADKWEAMEDRLSKVKRKLSDLDAFVKDLRSTLEVAAQMREDPKLGCYHTGRYKGLKCAFKNPSTLQCALCPYYMPRWLPVFLLERFEELTFSKPFQR
ncbi:MAG: hypothetical protein QMD10_11685 [Desulfitobacteriaceae bacterium]|nr:hypothetical protein [Desulfitobacteriaceae bacterium]